MRLSNTFIATAIIMLATAVMLGGCMPRVIAETANVAVSKYCKIPSAGRTAVRKIVDRSVRPNKIEITCSGD
jgi:hypothetical protein